MKGLQALLAKHPDKIGSVSDEGREDGYWLFLKPGWRWDECHSVHEWNMRDLRAAFRDVQPCDCGDCRARKEN
jgi:hypothetical protein